MNSLYQHLIHEVYEAFNARDIDKVFSSMLPDVHWPNGWEGGYVTEYEEVRSYWTRQWREIDPIVTPVSIEEKQDGQVEVNVHQLVKNMQGEILMDGMVKHIYLIENGKIKGMEIDKS
ncbi:MAG: nuclear transport factor 2 family protein [Ferruginibacter sp.]